MFSGHSFCNLNATGYKQLSSSSCYSSTVPTITASASLATMNSLFRSMSFKTGMVVTLVLSAVTGVSVVVVHNASSFARNKLLIKSPILAKFRIKR